MVSKSTRKVPQARKAIAKGAFLSIGWFTKLQFKLNGHVKHEEGLKSFELPTTQTIK